MKKKTKRGAKRKLASRMLANEERKNNVNVFCSKAWLERKEARIRKQLNQGKKKK